MFDHMTRLRWFYLGWTIFMIGMAIKFRPWERGFGSMLIGLGVFVAVAALGHLGQNLEKKFNIAEARFNSRTGKVLKPGEHNV